MQIDRGQILIGDDAAPRPVLIVMSKQRAILAPGYAKKRPMLWFDRVEVDAERDRAVVGVWPGRNVLMPVDNLASARPLVIQFRAEKLDVGSH